LSGQLRKKSIEAKSYKSREIMDVNENAVNELMKKYPNSDLIHGHTHRQGTHNEDKYKRYVLGEWSGLNGNAIKLEDGLSFIEIN
jgi:UDP-2,3-diacylglucosamine hydrolase